VQALRALLLLLLLLASCCDCGHEPPLLGQRSLR
jgi:hypothetical protein